MTKLEIAATQLANKATSGDIRAARFALESMQRMRERATEEAKNAPRVSSDTPRRPEDMTDEELDAAIGRGLMELGVDVPALIEDLMKKKDQK